MKTATKIVLSNININNNIKIYKILSYILKQIWITNNLN